jgi:glycoside/pentoside/hexuronide:cation symporter, GPH family
VKSAISATSVPEQITEQKGLSLATRIGYGVGDIGNAIITVITGFFLYAFLLEVAGLRPAAVGLIFLLTQIWDAIIDPYIGFLSDRTTSRWGRKRVWLLFAALPLGVAYFLTWVAPPLGNTALFFYYLFVILLLKTGMSAVGIPYLALSAIMTQTYDERTQLTVTRSVLNIVGGLVAIILHPMLVGLGGDNVRLGHLYSAGLLACIIAGAVLIAFRSSFEREDLYTTPEPNIVLEFRSILQNRPFLLATGIFVCAWVVALLVQNNLLLYMKYWARAEDQFQSVILVFQMTAVAAIGFWGRVGRWLDKKLVYILGLLIWSLGLTLLYFAPRDNPNFYFLTAFIVGVGMAVAYVVPWSMLPDIVDYDELRTGKRRDGSFFGLFVLLQQVGLSLGLAASGFVLEAAGYINPEVAGQDVLQPAAVDNALRVLVSFVPVAILLLSIPLALAYPLTREKFAEVRLGLEQRRS